MNGKIGPTEIFYFFNIFFSLSKSFSSTKSELLQMDWLEFNAKTVINVSFVVAQFVSLFHVGSVLHTIRPNCFSNDDSH